METRRPEAPFISAGLYGYPQDEADTFEQVCDIMRQAGATELSSDFVDPSSTFKMVNNLTIHNIDFSDYADRGSSAMRRVTSYFYTPYLGNTEVTYETAPAATTHPVLAMWGSDLLGIPLELLSDAQRFEALQTGKQSWSMFKTLCESIDPLYGELAVEKPIPTPQSLLDSEDFIDTEVYLSNRLVGDTEEYLRSILDQYGSNMLSNWDTGVYISGWAPFNEFGTEVDDPTAMVRDITQYVMSRLRATLANLA